MAKPDVFIEQERITVVGKPGNNKQAGERRGDLEVSTDVNTQGSIKLDADQSNVTVGGGSGSASGGGGLRLLDEGGNPRVQVAAEFGPNKKRTPKENTVWVQGREGRLELGSADEGGTVDPSVSMAGSTGRIELSKPSLNRLEGRPGDPSVELDPQTATIAAGNPGTNPDPSPGRLSLRNEDGKQVVDIAGVKPGSQSRPAGTVSLYDGNRNKTVELRADRGVLKLGFHTPPEVNSPAESVSGAAGASSQLIESGFGTSGKILLNDGGSGGLGGSRTFQIEATEGRLEIGTAGGKTLFALDADAGSVKIPQSWSYDKF